MSLDYVNHSNTTVKFIDGVKVWSNPALSVSIDLLGNVLDEEYFLVKQYKNKTYPIRIVKSDGKEVAWCASYSSLFSRMVLGIKLANKTLRLKDSSKGWVEGNVEAVVIHGMGKVGGVMEKKVSLESLEKFDKFNNNATTAVLSETTKETDKVVGKETDKVYYTIIGGKQEFVTEDGGVFPTKELAEWHQDKVAKGKGNAQVVLDYNGGWVLAEQIFLQEVIYRCEKPYKHFKHVMQNNKGVVESVQQDRCIFSDVAKNTGISTMMLEFNGLKNLEGLECSKVEADGVNEKLVDYVADYKQYVESWEGLNKVFNSLVGK